MITVSREMERSGIAPMKTMSPFEWRLVWLVILMSLLLFVSGPAHASGVANTTRRDAALLVRAVGLYDSGNQRAGVHILQDYLVTNPGDVEARRTLASFYEGMSLYGLARTELELVLDAVPGSIDDRRHLMMLTAGASEWDDALALAEGLLQATPEDPAALSVAGRAAFNLDRVSLAEDYLIRALDRGATSGEPENMLGLIRLHQKRISDARTLFVQAVIARPDDPRFLNNLGYAHELTGKIDDAWIAYDRALRLEPENKGFASNLARIETRLKKRR